MLRGLHGGFGRPRIDHDDLGRVRIVDDPLPHDRMRDAEIAAHQHDHVGLFEVGIGIGRRVESERLLIGHDGRRHALPRVAVAVHHSHAELGQCAEQRHFFGDNLTRAQKGDRFRPVGLLNRLHALGERARALGPN